MTPQEAPAGDEAEIPPEQRMRLHLPSTGVGSKIAPAGSYLGTPNTDSARTPFAVTGEDDQQHQHMMTNATQSQAFSDRLAFQQQRNGDSYYSSNASSAVASPGSSSPALSSSHPDSALASPHLSQGAPSPFVPTDAQQQQQQQQDQGRAQQQTKKPGDAHAVHQQPPYIHPISPTVSSTNSSAFSSRVSTVASQPDPHLGQLEQQQQQQQQSQAQSSEQHLQQPLASPAPPQTPPATASTTATSSGPGLRSQPSSPPPPASRPHASSNSNARPESPGKAHPDLRSASPNKINGRPAVFSAIPRDKDKDKEKDKEAAHHAGKDRPGPTPQQGGHHGAESKEKKTSVFGKMFGAMKSSEHLHLDIHDKDHHGKKDSKRSRSRGAAAGGSDRAESGYESESGAESDASVASAKTDRSDRGGGGGGGFFKITRRSSGGKKDKESFAGTEQDKAAAMASAKEGGQAKARGSSDAGAAGPGADGPMPPPPTVGRRSSNKEGKGPDNKSETSSVAGNIGQSFKDLMAGPFVPKKSSVASNRSHDGRSEHGDDHDDKKGGAGTASLLKKYGACEKVAIGRGATAVVRLAHKWDKSTEKLYAVKEFRKRRKNESEKDYVKKLTSEFCISSTLHHPNIVETVDLVQDENHHWCEVMEYCPNGDLYAAIKKGDMSQKQIHSFFHQMVSGVAYLHSMGVAHRDIKPENLLLDAHNMIKITDFGVSDVFRMCWEKTCHLSKGLCGSEPYIAPEQFEPKVQYDARLVDVWACAVVFYCMQFQELPWRVAKMTDTSFATFAECYHKTNSPPPLNDIHPRECRYLIKSMLSPVPKNRVSAENILAHNKWFQTIGPGAQEASSSSSSAAAAGPSTPNPNESKDGSRQTKDVKEAKQGEIAATTAALPTNPAAPPPPSAPVVQDLLQQR